MKWKLALPLHIEYRTSPMLFYVPPLLPVMGRLENGMYEHSTEEFFTSLSKARFSIKYLAKLFSAGNEEVVTYSLKKMLAVRYFRRSNHLTDIDLEKVEALMREADLTEEEANDIFTLTSLPTVYERFVLPPIQREIAIEAKVNPEVCKGCTGCGEVVQTGREL